MLARKESMGLAVDQNSMGLAVTQTTSPNQRHLTKRKVPIREKKKKRNAHKKITQNMMTSPQLKI